MNETVYGRLDQEIDAKSHQIGDAHAKTPVEDKSGKSPSKGPRKGWIRTFRIPEATPVAGSGQLQQNLQPNRSIGQPEQIVHHLPKPVEPNGKRGVEAFLRKSNPPDGIHTRCLSAVKEGNCLFLYASQYGNRL